MILSKIFIQLLYMSIMAGYVVLAVMIARFLLRKRPKIYSYILWSLVAFRLLVPVSVTSSFSFFNLSYLPDLRLETIAENSDQFSGITTGDASTKGPSKTEQSFAQSNSRQTSEQAERQKIEGVQNPQVEKPIDDQSEIISPLENDADMVPLTEGNITAGSKERLFEIGSVIWLFGVGVLLFYTLFRIIAMRKQLASAVLWQDNIYEADGIKSPFVFGILRPRIYVPFSLEEVERDYILRHEKEHIRRGDHLVKYAAYLLAIAYWFHPLIWAAYYFMCQDMEMSCDEKVISELDGEKRKDYSRILLAFATEKKQFAGPLYFGENNVEKRITNILKSKKGGIAAAVLGVALIGALILFFATDAKKATGENVAIGINIGPKSQMEIGLYGKPEIQEMIANIATSDVKSEEIGEEIIENLVEDIAPEIMPYVKEYVELDENEKIKDYEWMEYEGDRVLRIKIDYVEPPEGSYAHKKDHFIFMKADETVSQVLLVDYEDKGIHSGLNQGIGMDECENNHSLGWGCDFEAHFEDVTFDGKEDLIIAVGDSQYASYYCAYIYEDNEFRYERSFEHIPSYEIDSDKKVIYGSDTDGVGQFYDTIYEYKNGEFICVNSDNYTIINDEKIPIPEELLHDRDGYWEWYEGLE